MMIKLVYFASIREQIGLTQESIELPENIDSVSHLVALLVQRGEAWDAVFTGSNVLFAVNQEMVNGNAKIVSGDEVAFFPPVTGG